MSTGTATRVVHAIEFKIVADTFTHMIVWPATENDCVRLINPKVTWLTARAGDVFFRRREKSVWYDRRVIEFVRLYRVHPTTENDRIVTCAQDWLDGKV